MPTSVIGTPTSVWVRHELRSEAGDRALRQQKTSVLSSVEIDTLEDKPNPILVAVMVERLSDRSLPSGILTL